MGILDTSSLPALYSALRARSWDRAFFRAAAAASVAAAGFVGFAGFAGFADEDDDCLRFDEVEEEADGLRFLLPEEVVVVVGPPLYDPPRERAGAAMAVAVAVAVLAAVAWA